MPDFVDLSGWAWWWEFNKDPLLELKAHLFATPTTSGTDGFYLGQGEMHHEAALHRPDARRVREKVVPALRAALGSKNPEILAASLIALAKIREGQGESYLNETESLLERFLDHSHSRVSDAAVLALGILGRDRSALLLGEVLNGDEHRSTVRTRTFAAYALGILGARAEKEDVRLYVVRQLIQALVTEKHKGPDLPSACILALGRVPLEDHGPHPAQTERPDDRIPLPTCRAGQLAFLLDLLADDKLNRIAHSHVPSSLAALLASWGHEPDARLKEETVQALLMSLRTRRGATRDMQRSAILALGRIGDSDDDPIDIRIRERLGDASFFEQDAQAARFALIALGEVAGRPGRGGLGDVSAIRSDLLRTLARGRKDAVRWSALALGLLERGQRKGGQVVNADVLAAMDLTLQDCRAGNDVGAVAIATGLLGDIEGNSGLLRQLERSSEEDARGKTAIALGMIGEHQSLPILRKMVEEATYAPSLLAQSSVGLGLMGSSASASLLASKLATARSSYAQASIAHALGRIGDARSIEPLVELLEDRDQSDQVRAFAASALGRIADSTALPLGSLYTLGTNYTAAPLSLFSPNGFGVLNLL